jgi:hypothetical protein
MLSSQKNSQLKKFNMAFIETRMFTDTEQIVAIQPNETDNGLVLVTSEIDGTAECRTYLTFEEAKQIASLLEQTVIRLKK